MVVRVVGLDVITVVTPGVLPLVVVAMVTVVGCVIVMMAQFVTVVVISIGRYGFCHQ